MPTRRSPPSRASSARSRPRPARPFACGSERSTIVQPRWPRGQVTTAARGGGRRRGRRGRRRRGGGRGRRRSGARVRSASAWLSVTVRLPPVAVEASGRRARASPEIAIAAAVPRIATTRPSSDGQTQPRRPAASLARAAARRGRRERLLARRGAAPHSRQYSCRGSAACAQRGHSVALASRACSLVAAVAARAAAGRDRPAAVRAEVRAPEQRRAALAAGALRACGGRTAPSNASSSWIRASSPISSAQRSSSRSSRKRSRRYISSASPPRSRSRSSRTRRSARRSRRSSPGRRHGAPALRAGGVAAEAVLGGVARGLRRGSALVSSGSRGPSSARQPSVPARPALAEHGTSPTARAGGRRGAPRSARARRTPGPRACCPSP